MINNNLKKYRVWKNVTQKMLADDTKIHINTIRNIENKNLYPNYIMRAKLCKYFDVMKTQMFYKEENKK